MSLLNKDPEFRTLTGKILAGKKLKMSFSNNRTVELWKSFMPHRKDLSHRVSEDLYSLQVYPPRYFNEFNPDSEFIKWAAAEVSEAESLPDGCEFFELKSGLYAVFTYQGVASEAAASFKYILGTWLPCSGYLLDSRPHFEILGERYRNDSPDSMEELWIPVKPAETISLAPWLTVSNSREAIDFYKSAFGAVEVYRMEGEGADLVARLSVGGAEFWVSNGSPEESVKTALGGGNVRMILTVADPDLLFSRALKAGAKEIFPVGEDYGWRLGRLADPFGLHWEIGRELMP
jgi:AraC family transcriptional regulator